MRPSARHPALVGLELTARSVTSVVTDLAGWVLARADAPVAVSRPRPGWVEANPHDWLAAAILAIRRSVHEAGVAPQAIGVTGHSHGLVLVDAACRPVRTAIVRPDAEAVLGSTPYRDLPDRTLRRLANPVDPAMTGPLLCFVGAHEPGVHARTRRVLHPKDWLRAQLTGDVRAEPSDASTSLLYDVVAEDWSVDAVRQLGLDPGLLPEILPGSGHQAGLLTPQAADMIGLRAGIPVAAGAAHTAAAALGAGLADGDSAQIVLGSPSRVVVSIPEPPASLPLRGDAHLTRSATDRGWCLTATVADHRRPDDLAAAVRFVTALAPVTRLQVRGADTVRPGLLHTLAELVDEPLHLVDPAAPAARAAALLGARAACLLDEETLVGHFSRRKVPDDSLTVDASHRRRSQHGDRGAGRTPRTRFP